MDFLKGAISPVIASSIVYPLELLKTNYQVLRYNNSGDPNLGSIFRQIYRTHGVKGYFRGIGTQLTTYPAFWSIYFYCDKRQLLDTSNSYVNKCSDILFASTMGSLFSNPFFVIRTKFQINQLNNKSSSMSPSYLSVIKELTKESSYRWLYRGMGSTIANNSKLCIQFPLYDLFKDQLTIHTDMPIVITTGAAGFMSKLTASSVFYPFDLIRSNQRISRDQISFKSAFTKIYKQSGIRGFYSGILIYNSASVTNFMLMMICKEYIDKYT
jgi:hypothetical protein